MNSQQLRTKTTFSEYLDKLEQDFLKMSLDGQFDFLEHFKPIVAEMSEFRKFVVGQLAEYLEKQMNNNLNNWLESEIKS